MLPDHGHCKDNLQRSSLPESWSLPIRASVPLTVLTQTRIPAARAGFAQGKVEATRLTFP